MIPVSIGYMHIIYSSFCDKHLSFVIANRPTFIRSSSLADPSTTSVLPPSLSSASSTTVHLVTTSTIGSTSRFQARMPSPSSLKWPSTSYSGVPSSCLSSSPTSVWSTATLSRSLGRRSKVIYSLPVRDRGRCGQLFT